MRNLLQGLYRDFIRLNEEINGITQSHIVQMIRKASAALNILGLSGNITRRYGKFESSIELASESG
ncbi:hypothetical protein BA893_08705 [Vibrio natriegens]|nr:hypothetical protein BA893_08705 [Vibrio natriegens]